MNNDINLLAGRWHLHWSRWKDAAGLLPGALILSVLLSATRLPGIAWAQSTLVDGASTSKLTAPTNLVRNGGFEQDAQEWGWTAANGAQSSGELDAQEKHSGPNSYRLTNASAFAPNVFGRVYQTVHALRPYTTYRISAWVKGKGVGIAWIGGGAGWGLRQRFPEGDFDWQQVSTEYSTGPSAAEFELMVLMESPTQTLWVDDVEMVEVRADALKRAQAERETQTTLDAEISHLQQVHQSLGRHPQLRHDRTIMMGVAIAERFLARVQRPASEVRQSTLWSRLQVEEVKQVLTSVEQRIEQAMRAATPSRAMHSMNVPQASGKAVLRDGVFVTDTISAQGQREKNRPYYFGGYGHFNQVVKDLANFPALGASVVQDGRHGPAQVLNPDFTLTPAARDIKDTLGKAAKANVKVDVLLSPHYFPDWAIKQTPELLNGNQGFIGFNIDHPKAREIIQKHLQAVVSLVKDEPALLSLCLSNEPVYTSSGRDPYSRSLWVDYLRRRHGNVLSLNALYGTGYQSLEKVPVPGLGMPKEVGAQRAYWDWVRFNQQHFADWHGWMSGLIKAGAPTLLTHAKPMVFFTFDRNLLHFGVDPELFCEVTDIAGCDAYAFPSGGDEVYSWLTQEMWYDLLHSFRNQPVFNSENHLIPDGSPPDHFSPEHTRAAFWQGGLHHQGATTMWVWEEDGPGGLSGSIYFRPSNIYAAGRAFLDLNRLSREVTAINQARPRVALLYSMPSNFWEADYGATVTRLYTMLNYCGQQSTFISERQLQSGRYADVEWVILPRATHVNDATVQALRAFVQRGGKLLFVGEGNLAWDEYHQARMLPAEFNQAARLELKSDDAMTAGILRKLLCTAGLPLVEMQDAATKQPTWHVEYRIVPDGKRFLIPLINFSTKAQTVQLKLPGGQQQARDLLSGETIDMNKIELSSIEPRLLQVGAE